MIVKGKLTEKRRLMVVRTGKEQECLNGYRLLAV